MQQGVKHQAKRSGFSVAGLLMLGCFYLLSAHSAHAVTSFNFTDVTGATAGALVTETETVSGFTGTLTATVAGTADAQISADGSTWGTTADLTSGGTLHVRMSASNTLGTSKQLSVALGDKIVNWQVTTSCTDTIPDAFSFTDVTGANTSTLTNSNIVLITGLVGSSPISISGGSAEYRVCSDAACATVDATWSSAAATITNGKYVQLRMTSAAVLGEGVDTTLTIGGVTDTWSVGTAIAPGTCPSTSGLVGHWKFDDGASSATATDSSGNGRTGTLTNMTPSSDWFVGKIGTALDFDGSNDDVQIAHHASLDLVSAGTMAAWVKRDAEGPWASIFAKGETNADNSMNYGLEFTDADALVCDIANGSVTDRVTSTLNFSTGTWYHVACTWDGSNVRMYINGSLHQSMAQTITPLTNTGALRIGQWADVDNFDGQIDDARIYSRALNAAELGALYNGGAGCEVGDVTPNAFSFTDVTGAATSTQTLSNIVQITGLTGTPPISISGGSASYRICSDAACTTVDKTWTTGANVIANGKYVQVRMTSSASGSTAVNTTLTIGSVTDNWSVTTAAPPCGGVGGTCADGSKYIGTSTASYDGGNTKTVNYFVATADSSTGAVFSNPARVIQQDDSLTPYDGRNTGVYIQQYDSLTNFPAVKVCEDLVAHGKSDWYLPSNIEFDFYIRPNYTTIGGFSTGTRYWTASGAIYNTGAVSVQLPTGASNSNQTSSYRVRCIRRDYVAPASDPNDPVWTTAAGTIATVNTGQAVSVSVSATDASAITYTKYGSNTDSYNKPLNDSWLSVSSSGTVTGTAPAAGGMYYITVVATDTSDNFALRTFRVQVNPLPCGGYGGTCADGTKYAGRYQNYNYYVTAADNGAAAAFSTVNENLGSPNWDGAVNTQNILTNFNINNYVPAKRCNDLVANSKSDWYLPSIQEMLRVGHQSAAIGGFSTSANYSTSSQSAADSISVWSGLGKYTLNAFKSTTYNVRCVRKDPI